MEGFELRNFPEDTISESLLNEATTAVSHYVVSFSVNVRPSGSATLVRIDDAYGFLTAAHVVDDIVESGAKTFEVVLSSKAHRVSLETQFLDVAKFGPTMGSFPGPDLAFVRLHDAERIASLRATKSFYSLTSDAAPIFEAIPRKAIAYCVVAGMPAEKAVETGERHTPQHVWRMALFFGRAQVMEEMTVDGFSYLRCSLWAGANTFPKDYGGMSGGGIWHLPFCMEESPQGRRVFDLKPELIGVVFHQSDLVENSRTLLGHSYRDLRSKLADCTLDPIV